MVISNLRKTQKGQYVMSNDFDKKEQQKKRRKEKKWEKEQEKQIREQRIENTFGKTKKKERNYEVGRDKPPKDNQFGSPSGKGNPRGVKPKKSASKNSMMDMFDIFRQVCNESTSIQFGGKALTHLEAAIHKMSRNHAQGKYMPKPYWDTMNALDVLKRAKKMIQIKVDTEREIDRIHELKQVANFRRRNEEYGLVLASWILVEEKCRAYEAALKYPGRNYSRVPNKWADAKHYNDLIFEEYSEEDIKLEEEQSKKRIESWYNDYQKRLKEAKGSPKFSLREYREFRKQFVAKYTKNMPLESLKRLGKQAKMLTSLAEAVGDPSKLAEEERHIWYGLCNEAAFTYNLYSSNKFDYDSVLFKFGT
jgi:hypothetical protein